MQGCRSQKLYAEIVREGGAALGVHSMQAIANITGRPIVVQTVDGTESPFPDVAPSEGGKVSIFRKKNSGSYYAGISFQIGEPIVLFYELGEDGKAGHFVYPDGQVILYIFKIVVAVNFPRAQTDSLQFKFEIRNLFLSSGVLRPQQLHVRRRPRQRSRAGPWQGRRQDRDGPAHRKPHQDGSAGRKNKTI